MKNSSKKNLSGKNNKEYKKNSNFDSHNKNINRSKKNERFSNNSAKNKYDENINRNKVNNTYFKIS